MCNNLGVRKTGQSIIEESVIEESVIEESVIGESVTEESVIEEFECTYYQRYLLSGLVYVHEVYTGTE